MPLLGGISKMPKNSLVAVNQAPTHRRTYISLFSSAGVGCYGFKLSGYDCIATNELLESRLKVQRANRKCKYDSGYICGDITTDDVKSRLYAEIAKWGQEEHLGQVDVVFATPPCQGMSTVNYKKKNEKPRNSLVVEAIKLIKDINPKIFVFENVRAFMTTTCKDISGKDMLIGESIMNNLSADYNIYHKVINFKDYGIPSSRPRTVVIGTSKQMKNVAPLNLFPTRQSERTLREAIGDLPSLQFGERSASDPYHFFREYPRYMEAWISELKEGQGAFENSDPERIPYRLDKHGNKVMNKGAYMGNKYRRLFWDRPSACVTTRNDQLASQDTIHPTDNRVLSIRELMRLMTIPDTFLWSEENIADRIDYRQFLKKNELNIRRCIGEAVPTHIVRQIADKTKSLLDFEDFVNSYDAAKKEAYIHDAELCGNFYIETFVKEQMTVDANKTGSFYTSQFVVFDAIKTLNIKRPVIHVLEPSVGLGAFLPQLTSLFSDADKLIIDCVEIDEAKIESLKESLEKLELGSNVTLNFIHGDFLDLSIAKRYDLVVTNPPYGKSPRKYPEITGCLHKTRNLFALFLLKLYGMAGDIVCIIPKNFAIADEFYSVRKLYEDYPIVRICDFGVKFFKKVFVEIISIHFSKSYSGSTAVIDYINEKEYSQPQGYIYHEKLWLLYRDAWFDEYIQTLQLDVFDFVRDRAITNAHLLDKGKIRVLRSKNIEDDSTINIKPGYDKYIDDATPFAIGKYLNSRSIMMPNFTYNTRAAVLPDHAIPNGSIVLLIPKVLVNVDLSLYASKQFRRYYAIVKSFSRFTLNIDNCSIYYIGVKKWNDLTKN